MDGRDLVVTFRALNVTDRRLGGTVFSDRFYRQKGEGRLDESDRDEPTMIETDRLVVHGPNGTEPLAEPPGATAQGDRVVWKGDSVSTRTYLLFATQGTPDALATVLTTVDVLAWASLHTVWGTAFAWVSLVAALAGCLRYTGRVDSSDRWSPRSDRGFQAVVLAPVGIVVGSTALGVFGSLFSLVVVVLAVLVVRSSYVSRESSTPSGDATGTSNDAPADSTDPRYGHANAPEERPRIFYEDTATTVKRVAPDVFATSRARNRTRVAAAVAAVAALATLGLAADYRGSYAGTVAKLAALIPLAVFPAIGFAVVDGERARLRWIAVGSALASAWVVAFGTTVDLGAHDVDGIWLVSFWGLVASYVGILLFYAGLWWATR